MKLHVVFSLTAWVCVAACSDDGATDAGKTATGTSGDGDGDGDSETGDGDGDGDTGDGDGDSETGDGDGDSETGDGDGDSGNICATCSEDELCLARANDACSETFGYTLECIAKAPGCDESLCTGLCAEALCGGPFCVPACGQVEGVDMWCGNYSNLCDPVAQDCPEGEKCAPYSNNGGPLNSAKCVPIVGDGGLGDACTYGGRVEATDNCDATHFCVPAPDSEMGTCTSLCLTDDPQSCTDPYTCVAVYEPNAAPIGLNNLGVCIVP